MLKRLEDYFVVTEDFEYSKLEPQIVAMVQAITFERIQLTVIDPMGTMASIAINKKQIQDLIDAMYMKLKLSQKISELENKLEGENGHNN